MAGIAPISQSVWDMKYRFKAPDGEPVDRTIEDTWRRVANALAAIEADSKTWSDRFFEILRDFEFLPAGRILAGAGTGRVVTLFNCFVMGTIADDLSDIFANLREAALTMQQGGGIGFDFSTLRPKGAPVHGVGADASGPVSFMDVWDAMCRTIMSAGSRRGAMMGTLRCDHPDIETFIAVKQKAERLRMFNLSVLVTDAFMEAVAQDQPWELKFGGVVHRVVEARALWDSIMRATYDYAEPGVIFIDRVDARNNLAYCESISATNPCGEQPLPPYGACLLGSVNLARLVRNPFEPEAALDIDRLREIVQVAVRMMDNVIDISGFPLDEQRQEALAKRRIGLGVTGLADALILCGVRYGSSEAMQQLTERWMGLIQREAYLTSSRLAKEKGGFPLFDRDAYLAAETVRGLDAETRQAIERDGIRNALLTSIAPTGTISLLADNVSSGLEPAFSFTYLRQLLLPDGTRRQEEVSDYAYRLFRHLKGDVPLPDYFVDAQHLTPEEHLLMQSCAQKHVDSSISKTINVPRDTPFEQFQSIYRRAYELGCKGCTTYRPNDITGAVLSLPDVPESAPALTTPSAAGQIDYMTQPLSRPEVLSGQTYKLRWPESDHAIYVTMNDIIEDGCRRPFEVFINSKNMDHYAWTVALTRMISAVFRRGGEVSFVVEELKAVFDPRGGAWMAGRYVPSLLAALGNVIEQHMIDTGFLPPRESSVPDTIGLRAVASEQSGGRMGQCPRCGAASVIFQEGCAYCTNCGYSKCG